MTSCMPPGAAHVSAAPGMAQVGPGGERGRKGRGLALLVLQAITQLRDSDSTIGSRWSTCGCWRFGRACWRRHYSCWCCCFWCCCGWCRWGRRGRRYVGQQPGCAAACLQVHGRGGNVDPEPYTTAVASLSGVSLNQTIAYLCVHADSISGITGRAAQQLAAGSPSSSCSDCVASRHRCEHPALQPSAVILNH